MQGFRGCDPQRLRLSGAPALRLSVKGLSNLLEFKELLEVAVLGLPEKVGETMLATAFMRDLAAMCPHLKQLTITIAPKPVLAKPEAWYVVLRSSL